MVSFCTLDFVGLHVDFWALYMVLIVDVFVLRWGWVCVSVFEMVCLVL